MTVRTKDGEQRPRRAIGTGSSNHNAPVFERDAYEVRVKEDAAVNMTVAMLTATDSDFGYAGYVQYVLEPEGNEQSLFTVDTHTAQIRVARSLMGVRCAHPSYMYIHTYAPAGLLHCVYAHGTWPMRWNANLPRARCT
jgi:hypothetical protein